MSELQLAIWALAYITCCGVGAWLGTQLTRKLRKGGHR